MKSQESGKVVRPLSRIILTLEAGTTAARMDVTDGPQPFDFVFGLGSGGLTPFEFSLADRSCGDQVEIEVSREEAPGTFGHLCSQLPFRIAEHDRLHLRLRICSVEAAGSREIVRAMAQLSACGDGCDCGCGGHSHKPT
jgi:hypothetical protein